MAHYLVTGHTGFKGAWLTLLLKSRGHRVSGIALDPEEGGLFELAHVGLDLEHDRRVDVRDREGVEQAVQDIKPDLVIHLAAQALVRRGYREPDNTYTTNVDGTMNVLLAVEKTASVVGQLLVTTDKVYRNVGKKIGYRERDPLGGLDPYSASKAMADLLCQEFLSRGGAKPGAIVRAGNVVGIGDVAKDRLITEIFAAQRAGAPVELRNPGHVRPWQHVLDCLEGYLVVLAAAQRDRAYTGAWNIGPDPSEIYSVANFVAGAGVEAKTLPPAQSSNEQKMKEDPYLTLDSSRVRQELGWQTKLPFNDVVAMTVGDRSGLGGDLRAVALEQISDFNSRAS